MSQNRNVIPPHTRQMAAIKKKVTSAGEDVKKWEPLGAAGGNVKWCRRRGKLYSGASNTQSRLTI